MKTITIATLIGFLTCGIAMSQETEKPFDINEYLAAVERGEAGVDARDQTAARSGDPYAQARITKRLSENRINRQLNGGHITLEQAITERARVNATYQRTLASLQNDEVLDELESQNRELQRIRQEMQRIRR